MSHSADNIQCPNCNHTTTLNYCAQCGQQNHLHEDTTWGLTFHFAEHYFHYDNKFWQTLRALLFSPGKLTIAYHARQRMRYIPPISLYIFVSAFAFLVAHFFLAKQESTFLKQYHEPAHAISAPAPLTPTQQAVMAREHSALARAIGNVSRNPGKMFVAISKAQDITPKVLFFMIPFMALVLKVLFVKRRQLYFAHHIIFSLHSHTFLFIISGLYYMLALIPHIQFPALVVFLPLPVYFVLSLMRVYNISGLRAVVYSMLMFFAYSLVNGLITGYYIISQLA